MKTINIYKLLSLTIIILVMTMLTNETVSAQQKDLFVRVAKIEIDSSQLESYKALLQEGIETAVRVEPGVLTLYAVYDKDQPTNITVFEIYANEDAYKLHIQTAHFKKYKNMTKDMVKSLVLKDTVPIALASKSK